MDSTGKVIISPTYRAMREFKDGLSLVQSGNKCGYINTQGKALMPYTISGNNYFKLRDIMQKFNVGVGWDGAKNTITVDTSQGYQP